MLIKFWLFWPLFGVARILVRHSIESKTQIAWLVDDFFLSNNRTFWNLSFVSENVRDHFVCSPLILFIEEIVFWFKICEFRVYHFLKSLKRVLLDRAVGIRKQVKILGWLLEWTSLLEWFLFGSRVVGKALLFDLFIGRKLWFPSNNRAFC